MFIEQFYQANNNQVNFTRQQASNFAKQIADDFNPLHDIDAKRFCVPGDLLFSVTLAKAGLYQNMHFTFSGMVSENITLTFPEIITEKTQVKDQENKEYLAISASGQHSKNEQLISSLIKAYVEFSGHTFPHILVELMATNKVMINTARPMVMYESMSIELEDLSATDVNLEPTNHTLSIEGKRGNACLNFDLLSQGKVIGRGKKHMILSGLREYCDDTMQATILEYKNKKAQYLDKL